jgi:hypothetical protein
MDTQCGVNIPARMADAIAYPSPLAKTYVTAQLVAGTSEIDDPGVSPVQSEEKLMR